MPYNLIHEEWIPVKTKDGKIEKISPAQVTNPDILSLAAPRPDFNGALIQFLIGLLQTTFAPKDETQWKKKFETPPSEEELKKAFASVEHAFNLDGDGPRFMQDSEIQALDIEVNSINALLIENPGGQTLAQNKDHFIKRGWLEILCAPCSAMALHTLQVNAPGGGAGHLTSLRGGGPLTTLVLGEQFWQTLWLNILNTVDFKNCSGRYEKPEPESQFPWLGKTRTSEKKQQVSPDDVHPAQMYWATPRPIWLSIVAKNQVCDLCGERNTFAVSNYKTKTYGANYKGHWKHPLSPYYYKDQKPVCVHPRSGGIGYRHWLGLVQEDRGSKTPKEPAKVVHQCRQSRDLGIEYRLWAFGYEMDKMKARCWHEAQMPLTPLKESIRSAFGEMTATLVSVAEEIAKNLQMGLKSAWFSEKGAPKGYPDFIKALFWKNTEPFFFQNLEQLKSALENETDESTIKSQWHKALCDEALRLFDEYAASGDFEHSNPKRIAEARNALNGYKRYSNKIREILGLPKIEKSKKAKNKK